MSRVATYTNGSFFHPGEINSMQDGYEGAFSAYRTLWRGSPSSANGTIAAGTWILPSLMGGIRQATDGNAVVHTYALYFDPTDYAVSPRSLKLKLRGQIVTNATAPGNNYTFAMMPVTAFGNAISGLTPYIGTLGSAVTGSSFTINTPAASSITQGVGSDFAAPAAGHYVIVATTSATNAAGAWTTWAGSLLARQV